MAHRLAPQADNHHPVDVGVAGKAGEDLLGHLGVGLNIGAAGVKDDVHRPLYLACHDAGAFAATDAGGQDQHVVADARPALRSSVSPKFHLDPSLYQFAVVVPGDAVQVVFVDPAACRHGLAQSADHLAVFDHLVPFP